jgi:hypothetical protein
VRENPETTIARIKTSPSHLLPSILVLPNDQLPNPLLDPWFVPGGEIEEFAVATGGGGGEVFVGVEGRDGLLVVGGGTVDGNGGMEEGEAKEGKISAEKEEVKEREAGEARGEKAEHTFPHR